MSYGFRPFTADDLPLARRWLESREARVWWGDPDHEYELLVEDLSNPAMRQWVVEHEGRPFAYVQDYKIGDFGPGPLDALALPAGSRATDQFIGEDDLVGRGHGSAFLRLFTDRLLAEGAPAVGTDPDPDNRRAVRAYEKAGFTPGPVVEAEDGGFCLLMAKRPE